MASLTLHAAEVLLAESGELRFDSGVVVDQDGTIVEAGRLAELRSGYDLRRDHQILMPGVLNCHVHLTDAPRRELVPGGEGLNRWARRLIASRGEGPGPERIAEAAFDTLLEMRRLGTVAVGEVANNFGTLDAIARSGMRCRFIHELIGFLGERAGAIVAGADAAAADALIPENAGYVPGAHAPYSVSPELMRLIAWRNREKGTFLYQHLAEDPDERLLYERGEGPWRQMLEVLGVWDRSWVPPGIPPIPYYDSLGLLDSHFVAVHLADASAGEIRLLASRGVKAILSPYSNIHITGRLPLFEEIVRSGMTFALGTDGRGSNPSIDVFSEARILLERWPDLRPGLLLGALTSSGADVLQFPDLGALRAGTRPGLLSVEVERGSDDPGEIERQIILSPKTRRIVA